MFIGAIFTDGIDLFIVVACAATLFTHGIVVNTAQDAARALGPLAGGLASLLFGIGLLNVSILGAVHPAAGYRLCVLRGLRPGGEPRRLVLEAPAFHGLLTLFILCRRWWP